MSSNFFAILRDGLEAGCRRIRVDSDIQKSLTAEFERQASEFQTNSHRSKNTDGKSVVVTEPSERISFFPIYSLSDNSQVFQIENYAIDAVIVAAAKNVDSVSPLELNDKNIPHVKAIFASSPGKKTPRIYFQAFERRRLLAKNKWTLLQDKNVFARLEQPGFTVGDKLSAIYEEGTLLFRSFAVTSRFLNLITVFNEASSEKVESVLRHKLLDVPDIAAVFSSADTIMRKQFAAVAELKILDDVDPNKARRIAREFDIDVELVEKRGKTKITFPTEKKEQREFLTFLTEGYYKGPLTGRPYQSNSHRPRRRTTRAKKQ